MQNKTTLTLVSAAVLALGLAAGAQAQTAATSDTASAPAKSLSHQDSSFLKDAAEGGNAEVEFSKVAAAQSANADVKTFAQTMVDDHTKAGDELKGLAAQKGVKVSDKPSLTAQAEIKLLSKRKDASLDQHYASTMVKDHQDTIKLFQKEVDKGQDADVKAWAAKTLPTLTHHQELANDLKTKTAAEGKK